MTMPWSDDDLHEGVNRGLFYARKLIDTYQKQSIASFQTQGWHNA